MAIAIAMLKVLEKNTIDSGLDDIFIETGIYGPTTFGQIIKGKHMKKCIEAYSTLYLALSTILFENVLTFDNEKWTELKTDFLRLTNSFPDLQKSQNDEYFMIHISLTEMLSSSKFLNQLIAFCSLFACQAKYLYNFMKVFEILILLIQVSRQNEWNLHLASLNDFCKYFFAHNQLNYARMTPLYLENVTKLKTPHYESWQYLEENFCIIKSKIPFVGIGSNHASEQENKVMKLPGGVIGLTQNQAALNRFCLSAPILSLLTQ